MGGYKNEKSGVVMGHSKRGKEVGRRQKYGHTIGRAPVLSEEEEAKLIHRWVDFRDPAARDKLIESHLRLVPKIARPTADEYGFKPSPGSPQDAWTGYENVCRELIAAGNEGLLLAASRFDPRRGPRFSVCARWSIMKACREEAKFLRSPVRYPKREQTPWSTSLDAPLVGNNDEETPLTLLDLLTEPERDQITDLSAIVEARAGLLEDRRERIFRARYLTNAPVRLRILREELGTNIARVHQLEQSAVESVVEMLPQSSIDELARFYLSSSPPPAVIAGNAMRLPIDDWLDTIKRVFPWATQSDRLTAHRLADHLRAEAPDFNLNRVRATLYEGLTVEEIAAEFGLPVEAVEHLRQLVDWRYGHENRYTLTEAGLKAIEQDDDVQNAA